MENLQKLLAWVKTLPMWAKWVVITIATLAASLAVFTSCSTAYRVVSTYLDSNDTVRIESTIYGVGKKN